MLEAELPGLAGQVSSWTGGQGGPAEGRQYRWINMGTANIDSVFGEVGCSETSN